MIALQLVNRFRSIAGSDPLSAVLLACGALTMAITLLVAGYLALGATVDLFGSDPVENVYGRDRP